jgi:hypothetical protein
VRPARNAAPSDDLREWVAERSSVTAVTSGACERPSSSLEMTPVFQRGTRCCADEPRARAHAGKYRSPFRAISMRLSEGANRLPC